MRRLISLFVGAVVLVAVGTYGWHTWSARARSAASSPPTAMAGMPMPARGTPLRGAVTIDPRRQQLIGVRIVPVRRQAIEENIRTVGQVRYDETRLADVNVKVEGWIRDLYVDYTGQPVRKGQPLFTLYSPDLMTTETEYVLALKTRDQMQQSTIPDARQRADELVASARQRLVLWDLPDEEIRKLETTRRADNVVVFRAPVGGFVLEKQALKGLHVMPGQSLYKVADLSTVWIEADAYENELPDIHLGALGSVTLDAYPEDRFSGRVIYIYPYVDEKTRTNKVRFEFGNGSGRLKPGMYANVALRARHGTGLAVPTDAVLDSGTERIVFVAQGDGMFEPRAVKVGRRLGDVVQIVEGLKEGEQVATGATFFLDSESQLRASLQGYEPPPTTAGAPVAAAKVDIAFRTDPDPPRAGDNRFEVFVKDAAGKPIDDAEVTVQLYMPAMPTMSMPAMRSEARLSPAGNGVYRGTGPVMMAGRWDATVIVSRNGQRVGTKQLPLVAK